MIKSVFKYLLIILVILNLYYFTLNTIYVYAYCCVGLNCDTGCDSSDCRVGYTCGTRYCDGGECCQDCEPDPNYSPPNPTPTPPPPPPPQPTQPPQPTSAECPSGNCDDNGSGGGGNNQCQLQDCSYEFLGLNHPACGYGQSAIRRTCDWGSCGSNSDILCRSDDDHAPVWVRVISEENGQTYAWKGSQTNDPVPTENANWSIDPLDSLGYFHRYRSVYGGPEEVFNRVINRTDPEMNVWFEDSFVPPIEMWSNHFCAGGYKINNTSCYVAPGTNYCARDVDGCIADLGGGGFENCRTDDCKLEGFHYELSFLQSRAGQPYSGYWTGSYWVLESLGGYDEFTPEIRLRPPGGYRCKRENPSDPNSPPLIEMYYFRWENGDHPDTAPGGDPKMGSNGIDCVLEFDPRDDGNIVTFYIEPEPRNEILRGAVRRNGVQTNRNSNGDYYDITITGGDQSIPFQWSPDQSFWLGRYAVGENVTVRINNPEPEHTCRWEFYQRSSANQLQTPYQTGEDADLTNGCEATIKILSSDLSPDVNYIFFYLEQITPTPSPTTPPSTPTPTPTARAWIKVKEAPFAELDSSSTNFNNNLPTNVIAVDSSDDNSSARSVSFVDSPDTNYEKHGVITLKNDLRASSMKTSVVDKGIFIKNYGNLSLNKFGSFQDFLDYVKKFKEYETVVNFNSTSLNSYQDGDIVLYEPTTGSSIVNLSSISNLSKNLILLINVNTVNVDVDNFNVGTVNDSIKNNIVLITKNLIIKDNVNKVYGAYFADSVTIEASSNPLKVKGMLSAFSNFNQNKTLITPANQKPALLLIYDLKPVLYHFKALSFFVTQRR
ncbi:MAG: hypothetical protein KatS3mg090_0337 [Patescibacteria group bacterium]|nr:MAG: hypothetical protein KatS3mg090_0337 [Patescibacteria group bacterium]